MNDITEQTSAFRKAAQPALIQSFSIERLYGYRTISLESEFAATILIAKNGTGKTTLLGAMDAFLKMQLTRLRDLPFSRIKCRLRGLEAEICVTHDDVIDFLSVPDGPEFTRLSGRTGIDANTLFVWLLSGASAYNREERFSEDPVPLSLRRSFNYNQTEIEGVLDRVRDEIFSRVPSINYARSAISIVFRDTEIVYLPTYRRVELALRDEKTKDPYGRTKSPKISVATGSLYTGEIQFGLGDISDRLKTLNNNIINESNNGYRKISANIINDLLDSSFMEQSFNEDEIPSQDELTLFFSRIKDGNRPGPFDPVAAPNLNRLFDTREMPEPSRRFLTYFLAQLGQVIDATKNVEAPVDKFIDVCNKYLRSEEPSTHLGQPRHDSAYDDAKALCLNRKNLSVHVESLPERRKISLNALSSGEKQMISLFAKLFLYPKRKLVLIDEPELSLSIDWQSSILVDVLSAPLCDQIIAITHSPFVFDNELDPFARSLSVRHEAVPAEGEIGEDYNLEFDDEGE